MGSQPSANRPEGGGQAAAAGRVVRLDGRRTGGTGGAPAPRPGSPDAGALATLAAPLGGARPAPRRRRWLGVTLWIALLAVVAGTAAAGWVYRRPLLARVASNPWAAGVLQRAGVDVAALRAPAGPEARLQTREEQLAAREAAVAAREQAVARQDGTLREREQELVAREQALAAREEDLRRREGELQAAQEVARATQQDAALAVDMFRSLPPKDAAAILAGLSDDSALYILRRVGADQAASILRELDPARAARLTRTLLP